VSTVFEREYGRTRIKVYGGFSEIGGNCVVVEDGDRRLVFDNGIRFSVLRRFYGGRVEPLGPSELRSIGVIPPLSVFKEASAVYISHFHLDHVGLLGAISPTVSVKVPDSRILKSTLTAWYSESGSWLAYVPPDAKARVRDVKPGVEDENGVVAVPVSHSSYPAYAFLYRGSDVTVFYSGDLRFEPLAHINSRLDKVLEDLEIDRVDVAVLEGTNFGSEQALVTPSMFKEHLSLLLNEYELVSISVDPLDFEAFIAVLDLSKLSGRSLVVGSRRLFWAIEELKRIAPEALENIYVIEELETPPPLPVNLISLAEEVVKKPRDYTIIIEPLGLVQVLRKLKTWRKAPDLTGSAVVLTDPEPRESVKEVEEEALKAWLKIFGIQAFKLRVSGHYLPHHFRYIIESLKPRDLIPIHTEEARLMDKLFKKIQPSPHP